MAVLEVKDGNDLAASDHALNEAKKEMNRPTMILIHTIIGFGSLNQGSHKTHGEPLGLEDGEHCKEVYGYHYPEFTVPDSVYAHFKAGFAAKGAKAYEEWNLRYEAFKKSHPKEAKV